MRGRIWIFAVLVAAALVLHLAVLSAKAAQSGEDNLRARLAQAGSALQAQLELLDARLSPRLVAAAPDLIEATRPPADPAQPMVRPDDRALRSAASVISPAPDLLAVVSGQGAILSRRAKAAQGLDDLSALPLAKAALEGSPPPAFASFDGQVYRFAAARIPGNGAAVVLGTLVDDRLASQLKSQVDADVTLLQAGKVLASSLPAGEERSRLLRWAAAPAPGYGVLQVRLPGVDNALSGKLPRGATRYAVRGSLIPLDSGVRAALTVPAGPYLAWLGRYQAFYAAAFAFFLLFSLVWGLLARPPKPQASGGAREPALPVDPAASEPLLATGAEGTRPATTDLPWPAAESPEATQQQPPPPGAESLDPEEPPAEVAAPESAKERTEEAKEEPSGAARSSRPATGDHYASPADDAELVSPVRVSQRQPVKEGWADAGGASGSQGEPSQEEAGFPGDEPTRVEPVSAALMDKLRERDEEPTSAAGPGWGSQEAAGDPIDRTSESPPPAMDGDDHGVPAGLRPEPDTAPAEAAEPPPPHAAPSALGQAAPPALAAAPATAPARAEANVTLQDFSLPALEGEDPDVQHWQEIFDRFRNLKSQLGEPPDKISFEKFAAKLRKNRADLLAKHSCKGVRFSVYEKEGKAAIRATAIR